MYGNTEAVSVRRGHFTLLGVPAPHPTTDSFFISVIALCQYLGDGYYVIRKDIVNRNNSTTTQWMNRSKNAQLFRHIDKFLCFCKV